jgi:hypothetical protein
MGARDDNMGVRDDNMGARDDRGEPPTAFGGR